MTDNRRQFLKAGALTALSHGKILGANDRIRVAGIGVGGRASYLLSLVNQLGGAEIVALCDVYEPRRTAARQSLAPQAQEFVDYRQVLEQRDLDAVVIGSPDHWHVPMTIDAIKAGKDVYVEKPVSHTIEEGNWLLDAAAASRQVVQIGYQQRSWEHFQAAREVVASGRLGKIPLVLSYWYQNYLRSDSRNARIDAGKLDWMRWLGSAPDQQLEPVKYLRWRWFWDFGGGHLTDLFSHWGDTIHWIMGEDKPVAAQSMGGRYALDYFECPDTINSAWEYPGGFQVVYNGTLVGSLDGGGIVFRGSNAMMKLNREGFAVYPEGVVPAERSAYPEPEVAMHSAQDGTLDHMRNFLECVRSRNTPNAPVPSSVAAARVAHLGNQAYRQGSRISA